MAIGTGQGKGVAAGAQGYLILDAIIERLYGKSYEVVLREQILKPLGMTSSGMAVQQRSPRFSALMSISNPPNLLLLLASSDPSQRERGTGLSLRRCKSPNREGPDFHQRITAVLRSCWIDHREPREGTVKALAAAMADSTSDARMVQVLGYALATAGRDGPIELLHLLQHESFIVRAYAGEGISSLESAARWAVPSLIRGLEQSSAGWESYCFIRALGRIGGPEAAALIDTLAQRERRRSPRDEPLLEAIEAALAELAVQHSRVRQAEPPEERLERSRAPSNMTDGTSSPNLTPPGLREAEQASVWVGWYFRRGVLTILTAPLFLLLAACLAVATIGAFVQGLALLRATYAVFGFLAAGGVLLFGWWTVMPAPILYYSLIKAFPTLWIRRDATLQQRVFWSVLVLVAIPLAAHFLYQGIGCTIGWIADRDPCAAFAAGITGSVPPSNCP